MARPMGMWTIVVSWERDWGEKESEHQRSMVERVSGTLFLGRLAIGLQDWICCQG